MGAISALSTTGRTLERNGVLFAAAFVVAVVSVVPFGSVVALPTEVAGIAMLSTSGLLLLGMPFFLGGMLSMSDAALDGRTTFGTFVRGGTANYLRLLGAMVLFVVLLHVVWFAVVVAGAVFGAFVVGVNASGLGQSFATSGASVGLLLSFFALAALATLLPTFLFQFYAPAVVVSDLGIVDSFRRSASVVRRNLVSTLGYMAIASLIGFVAGIGGAVLSLTVQFDVTGAAGGPTSEVGVGLLAALLLVSVAISTLVSAFGAVYQVAFYDDCLDSLA